MRLIIVSLLVVALVLGGGLYLGHQSKVEASSVLSMEEMGKVVGGTYWVCGYPVPCSCTNPGCHSGTYAQTTGNTGSRCAPTNRKRYCTNGASRSVCCKIFQCTYADCSGDCVLVARGMVNRCE